MALTAQEMNENYDFYSEDARSIEQQFSEDVRGNMTWRDLLAAIQELEDYQLDSSVFLVNKFTGDVTAVIDTCLQMNIINPALGNQVRVNLQELASDEQPLLIY